MARRRIRRKATSKGLLVRAYLEGAPRWLLEVKPPRHLFSRIDEKFRETLRHRGGAYALYKGDKIYYIGLTKRLYWRWSVTPEGNTERNGITSAFGW